MLKHEGQGEDFLSNITNFTLLGKIYIYYLDTLWGGYRCNNVKLLTKKLFFHPEFTFVSPMFDIIV